MRSRFLLATKASASQGCRSRNGKRWENCCKRMGAEFVHADPDGLLVSSRSESDARAGIPVRLWHCSSFTAPARTREAFDPAPACGPPVVWVNGAVALQGVPQLYSYPRHRRSCFSTHHHRDVQEDFRPARFACGLPASKAAGEEAGDLLARVEPAHPFCGLASPAGSLISGRAAGCRSFPRAQRRMMPPLRQRAAAARRR